MGINLLGTGDYVLVRIYGRGQQWLCSPKVEDRMVTIN